SGRRIARHIEGNRGGSARIRVSVRDRWHFVLRAELRGEHEGSRIVGRRRRAVATAGRRKHQCRSNCCKSFHWSSSEGYCGLTAVGIGEPGFDEPFERVI